MSLCRARSRHSLCLVSVSENSEEVATKKKYPKNFRELVDRAVNELRPYLTGPTEERKARLGALCKEIASEQKEYKKVGWSLVRMLKSSDLLVVEECLRSVLERSNAPFWAYQAAKDYAVSYDARYGFGLIPSSAPMVEEIVEFWRNYYGIKE